MLVVAALVTFLTAWLFFVAPAGAHAFLVSTTPAAGARLSNAPDDIVLDFSEALTAPPTIAVRHADREPVELLFVGLDQGNRRGRANLSPLPHGVYTVTWRVEARDGHITEGEFVFVVGDEVAATITPASTPAQPIRWPLVAGAIAEAAGLAIAFGGLLSEWLVWQRRSPRRAARAPVISGAALASAGGVGQLLLMLRDRGVLDHPTVWMAALNTRAGHLTVAVVCLTAMTALVASEPRLRRAAVLPLLSATGLVALRGHAGATTSWWAGPAATAHILFVGAWAGALVHLVRAQHAFADADKPPFTRYARLMAPTVSLGLAAGAVVAFSQVRHPADLLHTRYGVVLATKLLVIVLGLGLAAAARRALARSAARELRWLTHLELSALAVVVGLSGLLANVAPPGQAVGLQLGPPPLPPPVAWSAELAGNQLVLAGASENQLHVHVLAPGGEPDANVRATITSTEPAGSTLDIRPRLCGAGCWTVNHAWQTGNTHLQVDVRGGAYQGGTVGLDVSWPPSADASSLLTAAITATRATGSIAVAETVQSTNNPPDAAATFNVSGEFFVNQQAYAGGASDVRQHTDNTGRTFLSFYIVGSKIWYQVQLDQQERIEKQLAVDPGHRIVDELQYASS